MKGASLARECDQGCQEGEDEFPRRTKQMGVRGKSPKEKTGPAHLEVRLQQCPREREQQAGKDRRSQAIWDFEVML